MAENKMEAVAQLFGKKLGEEFNVEWKSCRYYQTEKRHICKFSERGLEVKGQLGFYIYDRALKKLLTGKAVIIDE